MRPFVEGAYADAAGGRSASMEVKAVTGDIVSLEYRSAWLPFPHAELPAVQALSHGLRERFLTEASALHVELEGLV